MTHNEYSNLIRSRTVDLGISKDQLREIPGCHTIIYHAAALCELKDGHKSYVENVCNFTAQALKDIQTKLVHD